jgi:CheY-like chemotaxis protein
VTGEIELHLEDFMAKGHRSGPQTAFAPRQGVVTRDGNPDAVQGIVMMRKGQNPSAVLEALRLVVPYDCAELSAWHPSVGRHSVLASVGYDERLLRWSIAETLTVRGYEVAEAGDGRSAMQEIGDGDRTDLVLLDLHLPDVDDLRLLARMRQKAPNAPIILMTAFPTREIVEDAQALGASVLIKPFDLGALAADVEAALTPRVY